MDKFPLIKFVLFFICGIVAQSFFQIEKTVLLYLFGVLLLTTFVFFKSKHESNLKLISITLLIFVFGSAYYAFSYNKKVLYPFDKLKIKNSNVAGEIISIELTKQDRLIFTVETDSIIFEKSKFVNRQKILVRVSDSTKQLNAKYNEIGIGNKIRISGTIIKPRDQRNPGEFDYGIYLAGQGISSIMNVYKVSDIKITGSGKDLIKNILFTFRKNIDETISKIHNSSTAGLLRGLLLADKSMIEYEVRNEFINAGVIHVLAVSGLHVGFIILIFIFLFKRFNIYLRFLLTVTGLLLFLAITNAPASVTRASIMAIALILAPLTGRTYNSINSLALAALVLLLFDPNQLFNPGFQLSFSAVLAIVIIYPMMNNWIINLKVKSKSLLYLLQFLAISFAAQIGTLPFTLIYFHKFSIVAFAANFIVIPIIGLIVGLGLLTILIAPVSLSLAGIYASSNELLSYLLFNIVNLFGGYKYSVLKVNNFSLLDSIIFYSALFFVIYFIEKFVTKKRKAAFILLVVITAFVLIRIDNSQLMQDKKISIVVIDISQGDSFLIKFPDGKTALIDAGEANKYFDNGSGVIMPLLDRLGIDTIDYTFISHIDSDHYTGIYSLIRNGRIKHIYKPKLDTSLAKDILFEKFLNKYKIPINYYSKQIIKISNARLYILNDTTTSSYNNLSMNDRSGMIKLVYGNVSCLFTGDAGVKAEKYYIRNYSKFLKSSILKAGHHGSKTSSGDDFVKAVGPEIVLISAGIANKFKHPNRETLIKFEAAGSKIFRTDISGAIILESNGSEIKNINWKKEQSGFIF